MRHQKSRNRMAPEEIKKLKRDLGLDKQHFRKVASYVRFEKTSQQIIGQDNTAAIVWQERTYNIGGGGFLPTNRLIVPEYLGGLWRLRCIIQLDGATVKPNSNYRAELWVNEELFEYESTQATTTRQLSARFYDEVALDVGDEAQIRLTNNTTGGTVTVDAGSYLACEFLGTL